jgi:septal ring factor EnvC (AmiA/AmiB activator)
LSIAEWVQRLEGRVGNLETWAGPGQVAVLIEGQREIRADIAKLQDTADKHGKMLTRLVRRVSGLEADVATLKADVATLKQDMTDVKGTLAEILRRLPEPPSPN